MNFLINTISFQINSSYDVNMTCVPEQGTSYDVNMTSIAGGGTD